MSFLNDLKRQADALKTQNTEDAALLARNAALVEGACKAVWQYWLDLAQQLNVLQPVPPLRFSLDKATAIDQLRRGDFQVDARRKQHRGQEVFEHVVIHAVQKTGRMLTMRKDFPPEIERLEARLRQAGITPDMKWVRNEDNGRLEEVIFNFKADVTLIARLLPDHDQGLVRFQLNNFDSLETVTAEFPAREVGSELLDQLARWMVGQPNDFLRRAAQVKRVEA
jgi:hypothetical protein